MVHDFNRSTQESEAGTQGILVSYLGEFKASLIWISLIQSESLNSQGYIEKPISENKINKHTLGTGAMVQWLQTRTILAWRINASGIQFLVLSSGGPQPPVASASRDPTLFSGLGIHIRMPIYTYIHINK